MMKGIGGFALALAGVVFSAWKWRRSIFRRSRLRVVCTHSLDISLHCFWLCQSLHALLINAVQHLLLSAGGGDSSQIPVSALPRQAPGEHTGEANGGAHMGAGQ